MPPAVIRYAEAEVPTEYGLIRTLVYRVATSAANASGPARGPTGAAAEEHLALVIGDPGSTAGDEPPLVRVHSECWTGEVLRSRKCDCREQLDQAMRVITELGRGVVVYLRQEGRGIGLGNKVRAYALQQGGADTVDANRLLGFDDDARRYDVAAAILRELGVYRVALMTNNPRKVQGLGDEGIEVVRRVPSVTEPNPHNADYLAAKARKLGHAL